MLRFIPGVFILLLLSEGALAPPGRQQKKGHRQVTFQEVVRETRAAILKENQRRFAQLVSPSLGLMVVDWKWDIKRTDVPIKRVKGGVDLLWHILPPGMHPIVWRYTEVDFVTPKEANRNPGMRTVTGKKFRGVMHEVARMIRISERYYPVGPDISLQMWDHWNERYLGPAVEWKMCSDEFLYIYFMKADNRWWVYKIEKAIH